MIGGRRRFQAASRWALLATAVGGCALGAIQSGGGGLSLLGISIWLAVTAAMGWLLAVRVPRNPIGWLLLTVPALLGLYIGASAYVSSQAGGRSEPLVAAAAWLTAWLPLPAFGLLGVVLLLFPTGRVPSRRWRAVLVLGGAGLAAGIVGLGFRPGLIEGRGVENPLGWAGGERLLEVVLLGGRLAVAVSGVAAIASLVLRYRRSGGEERQQLRWLAAAGVLLAGCALFALFADGALNEASFVVGLVGLTTLPAAIGVAVLRYRLYDLGALVNRALVYGALSLALTLLYLGTVVVVGTAFDRAGGLVASLLATLLVAAGIQPLRQRIQHLVDRLLYGERRDPYAVLTGLTRRLQGTLDPAVVPDLVVSTLVSTLGLPYAAVELDAPDGALTIAERGTRHEPLDEVPLRYQGELVGRLLHAAPPRSSRRRTKDLLTDLADQAAPALQAVRLTAALQRSRERLVLAREEERRRLRGDLHDSIGPELAGLTMGLEAAENLMVADPAAAASTLALLRERARDAVSTVRAVVDGLRPPALDELGLAEAVRQRAGALSAPTGPRIDVDVTGPLDRLPAAVEVAAFHIIAEAIANAVRHAGAGQVAVALEAADRTVRLTVRDDGRGLPARIRPGAVGLESMRERAAELGGRLDVASGPGGTTVSAHLPWSASVP